MNLTLYIYIYAFYFPREKVSKPDNQMRFMILRMNQCTQKVLIYVSWTRHLKINTSKAKAIHTFVDNHRISEQPCATRAAMELLPRFRPSTIPAAIASTFFNAPAISTPITSLCHQELQTGDTQSMQRLSLIMLHIRSLIKQQDAERGSKAVVNARTLEAIYKEYHLPCRVDSQVSRS